MIASLQTLATVGVGDGEHEAAAAGGDQDHIQHRRTPELRGLARCARTWAGRTGGQKEADGGRRVETGDDDDGGENDGGQ